MFVTIATILFVLSFVNAKIVYHKCCYSRYEVNNTYQCTDTQDNITNVNYQLINGTELLTNNCYIDTMEDFDRNITIEDVCNDTLNDDSVIIFICVNDSNENYQCDSVLKPLDFWGTNVVLLANIVYTIPYLIIVILYSTMPVLRIRAYDKSVGAFNASYVILNSVMISIASLEICHKILPKIIYGVLGIIILYLTQASVLWLFIICYDMTSGITRFHWVPAGNSKKRNDKKKFQVYSIWVWGLSLLPTVITSIMEFNTFLPEDSVFRPNFSNFHGKHNISVVIYTILLPILALVANNVLFIYTTYRMIRIQRENAILNVKNARKKYFLYLKLYLVMDAPWLSGALSAIYPSLWIFAFLRMTQPILMLIVIIPRQNRMKIFEKLRKIFKHCCVCCFPNRIFVFRDKKSSKNEDENGTTLSNKITNINQL